MNLDPNKSPAPQEPEPTTGSAHAPVWLFVLVALLAFWGMGFLDNHGGGFQPVVYAPYSSIKELEDDQPPSNIDPAVKRGRAAFLTYCAPCHMETGLGNPGNNVPPLVHSEWVLAEGPNRVIRIVLNGLRGPLKVAGKDFISDGGMLPWRDTLTDGQIADILTFIRGNQEWGHNAPPITPEQVAKIRDETKGLAVQWTIDKLIEVPEK